MEIPTLAPRRKAPEWTDFYKKKNFKKARELILSISSRENAPFLLDPKLLEEAEEMDRTHWNKKESYRNFLVSMHDELSRETSALSSGFDSSEWAEVKFASHVTGCLCTAQTPTLNFDSLDPEFYTKPHDMHDALWEVWKQNRGKLIRGVWFSIISELERRSTIFPRVGKIGGEYHRVNVPFRTLSFKDQEETIPLEHPMVKLYLIEDTLYGASDPVKSVHILAVYQNSDEYRELMRCSGNPEDPEDQERCRKNKLSILDKKFNSFLRFDEACRRWFIRTMVKEKDYRRRVDVSMFFPAKVNILPEYCDTVKKHG